MAIIDVLIVVDAPRVLQDHGTNKGASTGNYVPLKNDGKGYVYMVTTWMDAQGEGTSELDVFAKKGDLIRWRMTSMSGGSQYQCFITHFLINNGAQNISAPQAKYARVNVPVLDPKSPKLNNVIPSQADDFYWESTVLNSTAPVTYHIEFCICGDGCPSGGGGGSDCGGGGSGGGGGGSDCGGGSGGGGGGSDCGGGGSGGGGSGGDCDDNNSGDCHGGFQWDPYINKH
jgi:hypothetical protein